MTPFSSRHPRGVAAAIAVVVIIMAACDQPPGGPTAPTAAASALAAVATPGLPPCPAVGAPLFDTLPIAAADFIAFRPLGFLSPPVHMFPAKHAAFSMTPPGEAVVPKPVRAPGRGWVKEIWEATFASGGKNYQLYVYPCADVRVYIGHVATLSAKLAAEIPKASPSCNAFGEGATKVTTCRHENMTVQVESGEQLGTGPDTAGIDFGVTDFRLPAASFVKSEHYDHFYGFSASPFDYFKPEVKIVLAAKTGHMLGTRVRTATPVGGTFMQDIAGTAQGNWFAPGKYMSIGADLTTALALVTDYVDPAQPIMSVGSSIDGMAMGVYSFAVAATGSTNRAFREVKPTGGTFCYETFLSGRSTGGLPLSRANGVLLMAMPSATTLKVELVSAGSCASAPREFSAKAATFER